jgi:hypothetical protein
MTTEQIFMKSMYGRFAIRQAHLTEYWLEWRMFWMKVAEKNEKKKKKAACAQYIFFMEFFSLLR